MADCFKHPLLAWRDGHHFSQAQAAEYFEITQDMWSRLERGKTFASPRLAKKISDATGIALDRLLNFADKEPDADLVLTRAKEPDIPRE